MGLRYRAVWPGCTVLFVVAAASLGVSAPQYTARRPVAITACGQAADALTVSLLSNRLHMDHLFDARLNPDRLRRIRTLVVVIGGSVSGLVDAAADGNREESRIKALLARARQLEIGVIAVHVGGESRRGTVSDRLIEAVVERADYVIVTEGGNRDGLFTRAARARTIPLVIVEEAADVGRELNAVLSIR